ncbi:MAG TPA: hypothetical protein VGO81_17515, partial [Solirubrobacteraceae bacterium]|nr:hypothetical protein [Solirubrobacteraceae bacterium]
HVVSRPARVGNPLVRLGFRLVGRREQVRFARRACERMGALVERELARAGAASASASASADEAGAAQLRP